MDYILSMVSFVAELVSLARTLKRGIAVPCVMCLLCSFILVACHSSPAQNHAETLCAIDSAMPDAMASPCSKRVAIQANGFIELNVNVVTVTGQLTKNGQVLANHVATTEKDGRGYIRFVGAGGSALNNSQLTNTGDATFSAAIAEGHYDVYYQPATTCVEGFTLPCQNRLLLKNLDVSADGYLDLNVEVVDVSGRLTKNEQNLADLSIASDDNARGYIEFVGDDGSILRNVRLSKSGDATFSTSIFVGDYDIYYQPSNRCTTDYGLPCQRILLRGCGRETEAGQ
jgi:hypothetical protein